MPCFSPLHARYVVGDDGKKHLKFSNASARQFVEGFTCNDKDLLKIPCGKCIGCKIERARQWGVRCMHEASLYSKNCFITLTYDDAFLPIGGTLVKSDFINFMKRLRGRFVPQIPEGLDDEAEADWLLRNGIRYYHCGEYGELNNRPHYHALLFNFDFPDKVFLKMSGENRLYTSQILNDLWLGQGHCVIGDVTFDSAVYVATYCTKVRSGPTAEAHYGGRLPEYATMSRRPGIGRGWFDKYGTDVFPNDVVVIRSKKGSVPSKPPRYYETVFGKDNPASLEEVKEKRVDRAQVHLDDNTSLRLGDRFKCLMARLKNKLRPLEGVNLGR